MRTEEDKFLETAGEKMSTEEKTGLVESVNNNETQAMEVSSSKQEKLQTETELRNQENQRELSDQQLPTKKLDSLTEQDFSDEQSADTSLENSSNVQLKVDTKNKQEHEEMLGQESGKVQNLEKDNSALQEQRRLPDARRTSSKNEEQAKEVEDSTGKPVTTATSFHQQVLRSFHKEEYTDEEIREKKQRWQQYEEPKEPVNDFPEYFFAGFWIRLFAFTVDMLCIQAITASSIGLVYNLANATPVEQGLSLYMLLSTVIYLGYFTLLTKFNNGQTIGKMIFGIRVVSLTETELSWKTVLIRELCGRYILQFSWLFYFGYLPTAFNRKKQHLADYFAETSVVTINLIRAFNKKASVK